MSARRDREVVTGGGGEVMVIVMAVTVSGSQGRTLDACLEEGGWVGALLMRGRSIRP